MEQFGTWPPQLAPAAMDASHPAPAVARRSAPRGRLEAFYAKAWANVLEPATPFLSNWHIGLIAEHLEAVSLGQLTRLLINMPPRYGKSNLVSVAWPVWEWIGRPDSRWIFASYRADLAAKHSTDRRSIIESAWYREKWGEKFSLAGDNNLKTFFQNDRRGHMLASSITSPPIGVGCSRLVVDDPHDPLQVESREVRQQQIRAFSNSLYTRLDNKQTGAIVIIMQRLHELDLSAHVLANGDRPYTHLRLPAEAEERTVFSFPRSKRQIIREKGDLLWPGRETRELLDQHRKSLGSYAFAGQYQQRPAPYEGGLFRRQWFRYWSIDPADNKQYRLHLPPTGAQSSAADGAQSAWNATADSFTLIRRQDCQIFATLDVAGADTESADFSVLQIWVLTPNYDLLLLHQWRDRVQLPDVIKNVVHFCRFWRVEFLGVEKNGVGLGVYQTLRQSHLAVRGLHATQSKVMRARPAMIRMEAGQIYFPAAGPAWLGPLTAELEAFPNSATKDQVDALAWAAHLAHRYSRGVVEEGIEESEELCALPQPDPQEADERSRAEAGEQLDREWEWVDIWREGWE